MTNFTLTLSTGKQTVVATKYNVVPRSAPLKATLDGKPTNAWTTEGRGSSYIYFMDGEQLYYAKVLATDTVAARTSLVIESEEYAAKFQDTPAKPKAVRNRTRRVVKA